MLKYLILLPSLIFASLFGYVRYGINPPPIAKYEPIFVGEAVNIPYWYSDTAISVFDINNHPNPYLAYDYYASDKLIEMDNSAKLYRLSDTEKQVFNAATDTATLSPNGRYIIYQSNEQICCQPGAESDNAPTINGVAVGDLETNKYRVFDTPNVGGFKWAADSSGFSMAWWGTYGGSGAIEFVDMANLDTPLEIIPVYGYLADRNLINLISPMGDYMLISNQYDGTGLYLWNTQTQQGQDILQNEYVAGAAFIPDEPNAIYVIINAGLVKYNIHTHEQEIIHPELNINLIYHAKFSPDLSHLAILANFEGEYGFMCKVYVVPFWEEFIVLTNLEQRCPSSG